ncbi:hypothetical protein CEE45_08050 [Candidatus Heimdallarchaeota archaeon B3_Heim]|nr:MAG: hypothetical protein CEE45_08050 [Candidatus Heimdallarchaeota archaeon B3_Heim]
MNMTNRLEDAKIDVKLKLAVLWVSVMFLYIYADYFGLHIPGHIEDIIAGEVAGSQITDVWLLAVSIFMMIPSLMICLSLILNAKVNRMTNIILGIFNIGLVLISGFTGETWPFFMLFSFVEAVLLSLIVWYAWKWPTQEG